MKKGRWNKLAISIETLLANFKQGVGGFTLIEWIMVGAILGILIITVVKIVTRFINREPNYANDPDLTELID